MYFRIDCTAPKLVPTLLAMLPRSHFLSHITRVCTTLTFSSVVASLGRPDSPSSSTLSLLLLNSVAHYSLCYKETPSQGFPWSIHEFTWEAFLSYRSTWKPPWFQVSPFCKCVTLSSLKVLYISNQAWPHAFHTPNVLQLDQMTTWQRF